MNRLLRVALVMRTGLTWAVRLYLCDLLKELIQTGAHEHAVKILSLIP